MSTSPDASAAEAIQNKQQRDAEQLLERRKQIAFNRWSSNRPPDDSSRITPVAAYLQASGFAGLPQDPTPDSPVAV